MGSNPACGGCGGPHPYDTSIPSVVWNEVVRARGLSEYLCLTCITREFVKAGTSFTATLYGDGLDFSEIEIRVGGLVATDAHKVQEENNTLRCEVREQAQSIEELEQVARAADGYIDKIQELMNELADANQRAEQSKQNAATNARLLDELYPRLHAAKAEGAQAERERCAKLVCVRCETGVPFDVAIKRCHFTLEHGLVECHAFRLGILSDPAEPKE